MATFIIVNGMPGTGKSTLAAKLGVDLGLPKLSKDELKEFLFDTLGTSDREWSRVIGASVSEMLYPFVEQMLRAGRSVIVESAFDYKYTHDRLQGIVAAYKPTIIEVHCVLDEVERRRRFIERNETGQRHPGHVDHTNYAVDVTGDAEKYAPLHVGEFIEVDTRDFGEKEYGALLERIRQLVA